MTCLSLCRRVFLAGGSALIGLLAVALVALTYEVFLLLHAFAFCAHNEQRPAVRVAIFVHFGHTAYTATPGSVVLGCR
jgi:hypothetical protein